MPNVLIVDINQYSGSLLKGIISNYYGVSISENPNNAISKIETALFDAVVVDTLKINSDISKLIFTIKKIAPHIPIIGVTEDMSPQEEFTQIINHPLCAIKFLKSIRDGIFKTSNEKLLHRELSYNTEIYAGRNTSDAIKCRLINLSSTGMLVENFLPTIGGDIKKEREKFNSFFSKFEENKKDKFTASLLLKQNDQLNIRTHIAFIDREPSESIKDIGFRFDDLKQEELQALEKIILTEAA
ncbi:MAG: hypothetical protein WC980_00975 [Candidatus Brocadiia bacterium]